jgi:hypothetical protein
MRQSPERQLNHINRQGTTRSLNTDPRMATEMHKISTYQLSPSELVQTAQSGTPDGSVPNPEDVVVCPYTTIIDTKINSTDTSLIQDGISFSESFMTFFR